MYDADSKKLEMMSRQWHTKDLVFQLYIGKTLNRNTCSRKDRAFKQCHGQLSSIDNVQNTEDLCVSIQLYFCHTFVHNNTGETNIERSLSSVVWIEIETVNLQNSGLVSTMSSNSPQVK